MRSVSEIIVKNAQEFPDFRYYLPLIKKAELNASNQPDISIEVCKSLLEGISKSIIERLDKTAKRADLDKMELSPLVKRASRLVREDDTVIEDDFVTRCASLAHSLGTLRNERGDVSHGKAVPKTPFSNEKLAIISLQMTEGILCYLLDAFYRESVQLTVPEKSELPEIQESDLEEVDYDENELFNDFLDENIPWDGKLKYSKAIYDLYYENYLIRLNTFSEVEEEVTE